MGREYAHLYHSSGAVVRFVNCTLVLFLFSFLFKQFHFVVGLANSSTNPICYAFFNQKYRRAFAEIIQSRTCCGPVRATAGEGNGTSGFNASIIMRRKQSSKSNSRNSVISKKQTAENPIFINVIPAADVIHPLDIHPLVHLRTNSSVRNNQSTVISDI